MDILKAPFWRTWNANPALCGFAPRLFRQIPVPANCNPNGSTPGPWLGGGSYVTVPSTKTYYVGLLADDNFRFKIDGTVIMQPPGLTLNAYCTPSVQVGNNPYLSADTPFVPSSNAGWGNWSYKALHIYPIELTAGCHQIILEGRDTNCSMAGFGGVIFDMTFSEIASATSENDLNLIWDSRTDLIWNLASSPITALCPPGTTPLGPDPCDLCSTGFEPIPCGTCIECVMGGLYNGYVVDKGGAALKGRGPGGIVNTNAIANPINTWVIPNENDWNTLITYLDDVPAISNLTPIGSYGTNAGGKMKDYTRDLIATCWRNPNVGAQNDDFSSGWAGTPAGTREDDASFSGLGYEGYWWSSNSVTPTATSMAVRNLKNWSNDVYRYILTKNYGCSIRLVRPAQPGETNGLTILDAYVGKNGTLYDGIVIGTQVWITKNLSETLYNNGASITSMANNTSWTNALQPPQAYTTFYNNTSSFSNILTGNIDPATDLCYNYPTWYVYRKCDGSAYLAQTEPGATTTPGDIQKAEDQSCWEFVQELQNNTNIIFQEYFEGNYFANNNTIYDDCETCNAIHTIYMSFETKSC
jgi:uncharacterized protein (TIGR02145 family)